MQTSFHLVPSGDNAYSSYYPCSPDYAPSSPGPSSEHNESDACPVTPPKLFKPKPLPESCRIQRHLPAAFIFNRRGQEPRLSAACSFPRQLQDKFIPPMPNVSPGFNDAARKLNFNHPCPLSLPPGLSEGAAVQENSSDAMAVSLPEMATSPPEVAHRDDAFPADYRCYDFGNDIGRGSFGLVKAAVSMKDSRQRPLAIKISEPGERAIERAVREEKIIHYLNKRDPGDHVVKILSAFEVDRRRFTVFERLEGNLRTFLRGMPNGLEAFLMKKPIEKRSNAIKQIIAMIQGLSKGVAFLETQEVVHRDIKPENVGIQGLSVRLFDFEGSFHSTTPPKPDHLKGTMAYLAPEVAYSTIFGSECTAEHMKFHREQMTSALDVWGVGCIVYEILFGSKVVDPELFNKEYKMSAGIELDEKSRSILQQEILLEQIAKRVEPISSSEFNQGWLSSVSLNSKRYLGPEPELESACQMKTEENSVETPLQARLKDQMSDSVEVNFIKMFIADTLQTNPRRRLKGKDFNSHPLFQL